MTNQQRGLQTRDRVLTAALDLFATHGTHTRIEDISIASTVSVGSIYHHFGSRDGLIDALYAEQLSRLVHALTEATVSHRDAHAGLAAFVRTYIQWISTHRAAASIIYTIHQHAPTSRTLNTAQEQKAPDMARLHAWLQNQIAQKHIKPIDPFTLELLLVGPCREYCQRLLAGATTQPPHTITKQLGQVLWNAVGSDPCKSDS